MNASIFASPVIWAAVAVLFVVRQFVPQAIRSRSLVVLPLVLAYFGWQAVSSHPPVTPPAITVFGLDAAFAVGLGAARGATLRVWREADGTWMQRGSLLTLGLWGISIALKVGLQVLGPDLVPLSDLTFFLALTFGAQSAVTWLRMQPVASTAGAR